MDTVEPLIQWFVSSGGSIDRTAIGFEELEDTGRSAVALRDIDEGHTLFTIPRSLLLSTRTSALEKSLNDPTAWESLGSGWPSLILSIMWEQSKGSQSLWSPYLDCLPATFSTPMFWEQSELEELAGTSIAEKIGKDDANEEYRTRIVPLITSRIDLFPTELHSTIFSLDNFHRIGSAILSRSFHVEEWKDPSKADESIEEDSDEEDEEKEDTGDISMVPIADMLNARFECDNARLFYEELSVSMVTTKPIKAGEQIWNTYGDPPNSDLLRRYGHVDLVPLPDGTLGNPADVVEIKASLAVSVCSSTEPDVQERIDWWLEEGGDDVFVVEASEPTVPDGLISLIKLLQMSVKDWETAKRKGKPPKPSLDRSSTIAAIETLKKRLGEYRRTSEEDRIRLSDPSLPLNHRNATIVALGEKRILERVIVSLEEALLDESMPLGVGADVSPSGAKAEKEKTGKKRGRTSGDGEGSGNGKNEKKARR